MSGDLLADGGALPPAPPRARTADTWLARNTALVASLCIVAFAFLFRLPDYGNLFVDFDEKLYLLVGDRMAQGELPFVDIWDRKPFGLFFLYFLIRLLGGEGFLEYQLVAAGFAGLTGVVIYHIARRFAGVLPSVGAACLYLVYMKLFYSAAGQAETFFNLFMAVAALFAFQALETTSVRRTLWLAAGAMLLCGVSLQVKYTVLPQCLLLGLFFLWRLWKLNVALPRTVASGAVFVFLGLVPTILVGLFYLTVGHFEAFFHANFVSIFERGALTGGLADFFKSYLMVCLFPPFLAAIVAVILRFQQGTLLEPKYALLLLWFAAGFAGFKMVGNIYIHYIVPATIPLVIILAPLFGRPRVGLPIFLGVFGFAVYVTHWWEAFDMAAERTAAVERMTELAAPYLQDSCLYVYDGPTSVYMTTKSCIPTVYVYPDHLNNDMEREALGIDTLAEVRRIMDAKPGVVMWADEPVVPLWNPLTAGHMEARLAADYQLLEAVPLVRRNIRVYARKELIAAGQ
ncbi:MAG: hypothetical protein V2J26_03310 [Pacificimonas sp.]|jgi:hypothetical protein|nr:hypothetical protein [Pacificimonas sp.]